MRALTLTQPWAGLVASGIKLVENRPRRMIKREDFGKPFAIHASREIDAAVYARIFEIAPELRPELATTREASRWHELARLKSAVIGIATIERVESDLGGITAPMIRGELGDEQGRWFFGPVGYVLRDVRALATPVLCRGHQGFWTLSDDVESAVVAQLGRAPARRERRAGRASGLRGLGARVRADACEVGVVSDRGPAICERCGKPGEREGDRVNPDGWFFLTARFDPDGKPKHAADDRLIIHACSVECRDALWSSKPRTFSKTTFRESKQPKIYPCGCARQHVNRGLCADYEPGELP